MSKRRMAIALAAVASVTLVGMIWWSQRPQEPFRIAVGNWVGYGPMWIAKEKGFFEDEGVDVRLVRIDNQPEARAAMVGKKVEANALTIDEHIVSVSQRVPQTAVLGLDASRGADGIVASGSIKTLKDLRGKTVAVEIGGVNHFFLLHLLQKARIPSKDLKLVPMNADAAGRSFLSGNVDAAVTWEPYLSEAAKRPAGHVLVSSSSPEARNVIADVLAVRDDVASDRQKEVEGVVRAWFRAVAYTKSHPQEANAIMAKAFDVSPEDISEELKGVQLFDQSTNISFLQTTKAGTYLDVSQRASELYSREGIITRQLKASATVDPSFVLGTRR